MTYLTKVYMCMKTIQTCKFIFLQNIYALVHYSQGCDVKIHESQIFSVAVFTELHSYTYSIKASMLVTASLLVCHLNIATFTLSVLARMR